MTRWQGKADRDARHIRVRQRGGSGHNRSGHTGLCGNVPDEGEGWTGGKALAKTRAGEDKGRDRQFPAPHTVARNLRCRPGGRIAGDEYTNKPERALQD